MTTPADTVPTIAAPTVAVPPASGIAVALLEAVKALPLSDQEAFTKLFREWVPADEPRPTVDSSKEDAPVEWPDFAGRIKKIFGDRTIPGDPQKFWDEERGRDDN